MKPKSALRSLLTIAGSSLLAISYSHAATRIWDGDTSTTWATAGNWDTAPVSSLTQDIANFNSASFSFAPDAGTTSINGITIGSSNGAMTLTTTNLSIGGSGIAIANGAGAFTISGGLTLGAAQSWLNNSANLFSVGGGTVTNGSNLLTIGGRGNTTVSSAIGSGSGGLTKTGLGTLTLTANNGYTGATTVNVGTLLLDKTGTGALAATSALTLGGGTFQVKGATSGATTQTLGSLTLGTNASGSGSQIVLDPNNGTSTTLTLGNAWTRNGGTTLLIDYSSSNTGIRQVVTAGATTGYTLSNGIYGAITVKDSAGVTGFATRAAGTDQAITRYDDRPVALGGQGTTLATNSNSSTTNFTTLSSAGNLAWSSGITTRAVNSLTIDTTTNGGGTIDMGVTGNVLTLTSGAILFRGVSNAILTGGIIGSPGAEGIIHQTSSTNTLTINSRWTGGAGSLTKDGVGTLIFSPLVSNIFGGAVRVNEGVLRITHADATGSSSGGIFVQNGAALELSGGLSFVADALTITGEGVSSGGALKNFSGANTYQGAITIGDGGARINNAVTGANTLTVRGITTAANADVTFGGAGNITHNTTAISGAGGLIKDGAGKLTTSVANSYTGATTVTNGTLVVNGSISTSVSTTVSTGATLAGTGTVGAATIQSTGILAPGDGGIESLNTGALTLDSGSFSNFEITTGNLSDLAISSALLAFAGTLNVTNIGGALVGGDIFNLFDWATTSGTFSAVNLPALTGGLSWDTGSLYTAGTLSVVAVPEPNVAALLGGLGMLTLLRRRR